MRDSQLGKSVCGHSPLTFFREISRVLPALSSPRTWFSRRPSFQFPSLLWNHGLEHMEEPRGSHDGVYIEALDSLDDVPICHILTLEVFLA